MHRVEWKKHALMSMETLRALDSSKPKNDRITVQNCKTPYNHNTIILAGYGYFNFMQLTLQRSKNKITSMKLVYITGQTSNKTKANLTIKG